MSATETLVIAPSIKRLASNGLDISIRLTDLSRNVAHGAAEILVLSSELTSIVALLRQVVDALEDGKLENTNWDIVFTAARAVIPDCWQWFGNIDCIICDAATAIGNDNWHGSYSRVAATRLEKGISSPFDRSQLDHFQPIQLRLKDTLALMLQILNGHNPMRFRPEHSVSVPQAVPKSCEPSAVRDLERNDESNDDLSNLDVENDTLPLQVQSRAVEIEQHASLVTRLINVCRSSTEDVSVSIPLDMERAILETHLDKWSYLADRYGYKVLLQVFRKHEIIVDYWIDQYILQERDQESHESDCESRVSSVPSVRSRTNSIVSENASECCYEYGRGCLSNHHPHRRVRFSSKDEAGFYFRYPIEAHDVQRDFSHRKAHQRERARKFDIMDDADDAWADDRSQSRHEYSERETLRPRPEISSDEVPYITFRCAMSRIYKLPWEKSSRWTTMSHLINEMFLSFEPESSHVLQGRYDLVGPDNVMILPSCWDLVIKPGMFIKMVMWPHSDLISPPPPAPALIEPKSIVELCDGRSHRQRDLEDKNESRARLMSGDEGDPGLEVVAAPDEYADLSSDWATLSEEEISDSVLV